jgi:hypothetical protein
MGVCMYEGWAIKSSPCTATFNDLLCIYMGVSMLSADIFNTGTDGKVSADK